MANPQKIQATVESIKEFGPGVYEVRLSPMRTPPRFKSGQFLHLTVDPYDQNGGFWPESRVFSIASKSGEPGLAVVYSVKGSYTKKMEAYLAAGKTVWLKLPYGDFLIDTISAGANDVVLIAGGTGISPYLAFISELEARNRADQILRLYYGVREPSLLIGAEMLNRFYRSRKLDLRVFVERDGTGVRNHDSIETRRGMLDIDAIFEESRDLSDPIYCISGPPAMIRNFKKGLIDRSVSSGNIRIDEWE